MKRLVNDQQQAVACWECRGHHYNPLRSCSSVMTLQQNITVNVVYMWTLIMWKDLAAPLQAQMNMGIITGTNTTQPVMTGDLCYVVSIHRQVHPQHDITSSPVQWMFCTWYCTVCKVLCSLPEERTLCLMRRKTLRLHIKPKEVMNNKLRKTHTV